MKCFTYIGFSIEQTHDGIILDHTDYVQGLEEVILNPARSSQKREDLSTKEQTQFRQTVGRLNWAVQGSRPDLAFDMIELSTKLKQGSVGDLLRAHKAVRKLKANHSHIYFPVLTPHHEISWRLVVFTDAAHANICDGTGSVAAHLVFLQDEIGHSCPLSWQANKIKRTSC